MKARVGYYGGNDSFDTETMVGAKILGCKGTGGVYDIVTDKGTLRMHHVQNCCEQVYLEDIVGDAEDCVGKQFVSFEEVDSGDPGPLADYEESYTWTFYHLRTTGGDMTFRWYGSSNGYYSESVDVQWISGC